MGSVKYADGEYAAEQPQGLPAVIAELTRWAAWSNHGNRKSTSDPGYPKKGRRLKRRITKCKTTRGKPSAFSKEEANQGREAKEKIFEPASSKQQRLFSRIALPHEQWIRWAGGATFSGKE